VRLQVNLFDDEIERWNAMRHGDADSFKWLYTRYFQPLYAYGRKIGISEKILQDSIHNVFVDLWFYHDNLSEVKSVKLYLYRSWRRKVNRYVAGQVVVESLESLLNDHAGFEDADVSINTITGNEQWDLRAQSLRRLVNDLSPRPYEVLVLRCYEEFSFKEIADILNTDEEEATTLVQHGLDQLKQFAKLVTSISLFVLWSIF